MAMFSEKRDEISIGVMPQIVNDLKLYLEGEDLVILVDIDDAAELTEMLCKSNVVTKSPKKAAILSTANFSAKQGRHIQRTISEEEMLTLFKIYRSYEASDKLHLLSNSKNYGDTWNYVSGARLSTEEMLEALFM